MGTQSILSDIKQIIDEIEEKSADGDYIFRGESNCNKKVSSNLFRELDAINAKYSDIKKIEAGIVTEAKAYTHKTNDSEIRYDLQHYGGKTNLIDFTIDYNVALFFACYGSPTKSGRVIILQKTEDLIKMLRNPQTPEIRVRSQKSVFVEPPKGYIEQKYDVICIPKELKLPVLQYLKTSLDPEISPKTIYNDIHGFISSHNTYWRVYRDFYGGLTSQKKADEAKTLKEKRNACKEAIEHYTNALEQDLQLASVYNNRGNAYKNIDEHELAIADFNMAIQIDSNLVEIYNNRGNAYGQKGEYVLAIKDLNKALELDPNYANAYNNRGLVHKNKGEYTLAIEDLDKAIELDPNYANAYNNRGLVHKNKGEYALAIEDLDKAIELDPNYANAYNNRGTVHDKKGEYTLAIEDFNTAIGLKNDLVEAYINRGNIYNNLDEQNLAIKDFNTAIKLRDDFSAVWVNRGNFYRKKGRLILL